MAEPNGRYKPLNKEQQDLVLTAQRWIKTWVNKVIYRSVIDRHGFDEVLAEAWLLVVRAASVWWESPRAATFTTFAMGAIRRFLPVRLHRKWLNHGVWDQMPNSGKAVGDPSLLLPDHRDRRSGRRDWLLHYWHSDEAVLLRRKLSIRLRLLLYLYCVECWQVTDIANYFGVSEPRISHLLTKARDIIHLHPHLQKQSRELATSHRTGGR